MRKPWSLIIVAMLLMFSFWICPSRGAKYAGEPFHLGVGGRALGLGSAYVALSSDVTSGFWNPSGLVNVERAQFAFMHAETFGSLLNHDYLAAALPVGWRSDRTVAAFSVIRLGGGGIKLTEWDYVLNRPVVVKESGHADYQFLLSVGMRKAERLDLGVTAKVIYRDIAENSAVGIGADLGARYQISQVVSTALMIRDVTTTMLSYDTGTKESIYPTLLPGIALQKTYGDFALTGVADGELKFENYGEAAQLWQGSISLDMHVGLEVGYRGVAFGRLGSDAEKFTAGVGIAVSSFRTDLAYLKDADIDDSFRVSVIYELK
jgi:hypothetical protein